MLTKSILDTAKKIIQLCTSCERPSTFVFSSGIVDLRIDEAVKILNYHMSVRQIETCSKGGFCFVGPSILRFKLPTMLSNDNRNTFNTQEMSHKQSKIKYTSSKILFIYVFFSYFIYLLINLPFHVFIRLFTILYISI